MQLKQPIKNGCLGYQVGKWYMLPCGPTCQPKRLDTTLGRDSLVVDRHTHSHSDYWERPTQAALDLGGALGASSWKGWESWDVKLKRQSNNLELVGLPGFLVDC